MLSEPREYSVADLQDAGWLLVEDGNHGEYRPLADEFTADGLTAFIRAADMNDGRVLFEQAARINNRARARIRKGIGAPGDVLLSHKGTVGKVALVPSEAPAFVCSPQTTFWRTLRSDRIDRQYLYAFLRSTEFAQQLEARAGETDMAPYVSLTAQRQLRVVLPEIEDQRAIGAITGAIDDKITLNRRMNSTLEATAAALFRSWFVDFDPVVAKAEGRRAPGVPDTLHHVVPSTLVARDGDLIPSGWEVRPVGNVVRVVGGATPPTSESRYWDGEHSWATPKDLAALEAPVLIRTERQISDEGLARISSGLLPAGTVLLSSRAPIGYLAIAARPVAINQGFIALVCDGPLPNVYMLHWLRENMDAIFARANGTTFLEISKSNFRPIPVLCPPESVVRAFAAIVGPLHQRIEANVRENTKLAALRDMLLPELLSGTLRLRDAEGALRAVG